ncbi:hypothetical protein SKAU_G00116530 [Synaphobranchus kaupii]|uniref:Phosphatidylethanolamine N-methyltransferase n=1 Tax=Synaphobranchus kaupii TaxID=118154 RepID=A0A9Q1IZU0_SYNKA|nr:hypothetical protein SKAU_G00116530 [Synaphobranchus kaupii]
MKGDSASVRNLDLDCCGGLNNVDYSKIDASGMADVLRYVDPTDARFCVAVVAIVFNPFFWNVVARWEHRTRGLTRLFGGPYLACYFLGFLIILLNVYRSHSITVAMKAQGRWELLDGPQVFYAGAALLAAGSALVLSSFLALGFTGTFLGENSGEFPPERHRQRFRRPARRPALHSYRNLPTPNMADTQAVCDSPMWAGVRTPNMADV